MFILTIGRNTRNIPSPPPAGFWKGVFFNSPPAGPVGRGGGPGPAEPGALSPQNVVVGHPTLF